MFSVANAPSATKTPRRVTIKEVAQHAGVANAAVSIVLNGAKSNSTGVSDAARDRILAAAENLGYRRNGSMVAARSGQFKAIGLLLSTHDSVSTMPLELWSGIQGELAHQDLHLIVQQLPDSRLTDATFIPKILREWMCDGVLVDYTHRIPPILLDLIKKNHVPAIWLNTKLLSDCVYPDNFAAGRSAGQYLLELGHQRIAYSCHLDSRGEFGNHFSVNDRREGCQTALGDAGRSLELFSPDESLVYEERLNLWVQKFRSTQRPTAVVTYGNLDGSLVVHAAELAGFKIPEDLSVITFSSEAFEFHGKVITSFVVPEAQLGQSAVEQLLLKIAAPDVELSPVVIPFKFNKGASCSSCVMGV